MPWPSARVIVAVASVPHITLGRVVTMVPSWERATTGVGSRAGPSKSAARMTTNVRRFDVRRPCARRRAQILRCPSPWNGLAAITARIAAVSSASDWGGLGPRLAHGVGRARRSRCA